jgi:hypothetical protein
MPITDPDVTLEIGALTRAIYVRVGGRYYDITEVFLDFLWEHATDPEIWETISELVED